MDTFNSFSIIIGSVAIVVGIYELITGELMWREGVKLTKEKVKKFLPYDVATYIIAGIMLALSGMGKYFPFLDKPVFVIGSIVVSLIALGVNVYFSNKILGKPDTTQHL